MDNAPIAIFFYWLLATIYPNRIIISIQKPKYPA